jgi:hypothetical protein
MIATGHADGHRSRSTTMVLCEWGWTHRMIHVPGTPLPETPGVRVPGDPMPGTPPAPEIPMPQPQEPPPEMPQQQPARPDEPEPPSPSEEREEPRLPEKSWLQPRQVGWRARRDRLTDLTIWTEALM